MLKKYKEIENLLITQNYHIIQFGKIYDWLHIFKFYRKICILPIHTGGGIGREVENKSGREGGSGDGSEIGSATQGEETKTQERVSMPASPQISGTEESIDNVYQCQPHPRVQGQRRALTTCIGASLTPEFRDRAEH